MNFCKGSKSKNSISCNKWIDTKYVNTRFYTCDTCWQKMKDIKEMES